MSARCVFCGSRSVNDKKFHATSTRKFGRTNEYWSVCESCLPHIMELLGPAMIERQFSNKITDGFGSYWSKTCPQCGEDSMEVVRPGKSQCRTCG